LKKQLQPHEDSIYRAAGVRVKHFRDRKKLSQTAVAKACGLTPSSVSSIEAGRQRLQLHGLFAVAAALDVVPTCLVPQLVERKHKHTAERCGNVGSGGVADNCTLDAGEVEMVDELEARSMQRSPATKKAARRREGR